MTPSNGELTLKREKCLKREPIDFHYIPAEQREIDKRLLNWRRWCHGSLGLQVAPGFELYRPDNYERPVSTTETDVKDAIVIQAAVRELPERQRKAIQWFYVQPTNPVRRARELRVGTKGLYELVCEARCELVRRGY